MARKWAVCLSLCSMVLLASGSAAAQDRGQGFNSRVGEEDDGFFDRWDVVLVERGKIILGYGDGKLFGFDVRKAMGNPAALSSTTEIKWNQALSELNHSVLMVAVRFPPGVYTEGASTIRGVPGQGLSERQFSRDLGGLFNGFREEEYIDLFAWLIRSGYMAGSTEEDAMQTFRTIGYVGGVSAIANMFATNQVNVPVTFRLHQGDYAGKPYDVRMKVQLERFGFGDFGKARMKTRFTLRRPGFSDLRLDLRGEGIFGDTNPALYREQVTYDLRRLGTYFIGAEQRWDGLTKSRGFNWYVGAAIDFITPTKFEDSRVRTGFRFNFDRTTKVPESYFVEFYERYRLRGGKRDIVLQGRGELIVNGIRYEGLCGNMRGNFLLGSTAPRGGRSYTHQQWDRFSRIYLQAGVNSQPNGRCRGDIERGHDEYSLFIAYAAPFDIDIAFEKGFEWWLRRRRGG